MKVSHSVLFLAATLVLACGSSSDEAPDGGAGTGGTAAGGGGAGGAGGSSAGSGGGGAGGSSAGSGGGGAGGAAPRDVIEGDLWGEPLNAVGSVARFSVDAVASDRGYVSVSISDWDQTCAEVPACPGAQVNFTLYVIGGTRADVLPGVYTPEGEQREGLSYEVVGGAGRYDAECTTQGGFSGYTTGNVTLESVSPRVAGTLDLTLDDGSRLTGCFDAEVCN